MHTGMFVFHYETNNVFTLTGLHVHQCIPLTLLSALHTACCFQLSSYTELLAFLFFLCLRHTSHRHQSSALTPPHLHPGSDVCSACKIRGDINMEWTTKTQQCFVYYSLLDDVEINGCNTSCDTSDLFFFNASLFPILNRALCRSLSSIGDRAGSHCLSITSQKPVQAEIETPCSEWQWRREPCMSSH